MAYILAGPGDDGPLGTQVVAEVARKHNVPMPATAATREALQAHFGAASIKPDPKAYLDMDFAALLETQALLSGVNLQSENVPMPTGLETDH